MPHTKTFSETVVKLVLPFLLLVVFMFASIFFIFLPMVDSYVEKKQGESLEQLTLTAKSILNYYYSLEKENGYSKKFAQQSAKNNIRSLRFGKDGKSFFWIVDINGVVQVNPYRIDMEGENQLHLKDFNGKLFINELVDNAKKNGEGFVYYKWQFNDDPNQIKDQICHIRRFTPWGWIIVAGTHIEDHEVELASFTSIVVLVTLLVFLLVAALYFYILRNFISSENKKRTSWEKLLSQEEKIRALLEAIPDMILRIDRNGVVLDFKEPLGCKPFIEPSDLLDNKIIDTWDEKAAREVIASIERVFVTTEHQTLIFDYPADSGNMKIEAHFAMCDENEILATFREISDRKE
jgi:PAS domain-containing protein